MASTETGLDTIRLAVEYIRNNEMYVAAFKAVDDLDVRLRSDAEQLSQLRRVGQWALDVQVEYNGPCDHEVPYADDCLQCQLRTALNPPHLQKETQ